MLCISSRSAEEQGVLRETQPMGANYTLEEQEQE